MQDAQAPEKTPVRFLTALFFASGSAGLLYQVAWQRLLFAAFGVDLESVTIVVSAFMLGLGCGALAGGWLADRWPGRTLALFAGAEAGIGLFGLVSPWVIHAAGDQFVGASLPVVAAANFLVVLVPASLMGATLPILIAHVARGWSSVGRATGHLYAANTLGAGVGVFALAFVLFAYLPLNGAIYLAASINLGVALLAALRLQRKA